MSDYKFSEDQKAEMRERLTERGVDANDQDEIIAHFEKKFAAEGDKRSQNLSAAVALYVKTRNEKGAASTDYMGLGGKKI